MSIQTAHNLVSREFMAWARALQFRHGVAATDEFFDSRNRDEWMDSFIEYLTQQFQQPDRIASNE